MEISYGTKVIVNPKTYSIYCPRTRTFLGKGENFNLVDCYIRGSFILGILTDTRKFRANVPLIDQKLDGRLQVNFLDYLEFNSEGIWN